MPQTVVHKAAPRAVASVLERLRSRGVDAEAVDDPNFLALLFSFGTYRVRIAVPDEEVDEARRVLREWDEEAAPALRELTGQVRRQFMVATLLAVLVAAIFLLGGWGGLAWPLPYAIVLLVWFGTLVAFGVAARMRASREAESGED